MKRALAIVTAVTAFATFPLYAEEAEDYAMQQGGAWPRSWPKELDPLRGPSRTGLHSWSFQRSGEPLVHHGIRFATRAEFEAAWPHLLKVKSKGAPIILRRGPSFWLNGGSQGVCVHTPAAGTKALSAQELKKSPWKTTSYIELIVDGKTVDLNRIFLPPETPIVDERFKDTGGREKGTTRSDALQTAATPAAADGDTPEKPANRKLRDFAPDDPVLSMYDHLWVQVTDPAKTEAVKKKLAQYGRVTEEFAYGFVGAYVYDDVDTDVARAALAKLDGVGETGTDKRGRYDKRIPDLEATLKIGKQTYAVDQATGLDLTFVLTNVSKGEPREFRSVDSSLCELDLTLKGPGAQSDQIVKTYEATRVLLGKVIRLEPGKSYKIPVTSLKYGDEYSLHQWKWTKPGKYTLTAAYKIGEVRYEAPPVKLEVVDK